jgi:hypothetical protein
MRWPVAPGADGTADAAPISKRTAPLAVLSEQEGGGLEIVTLTVLAGEFSVPEMQVLWQPAAQSKQAISHTKLEDADERRR